jgi:hypothetical protein
MVVNAPLNANGGSNNGYLVSFDMFETGSIVLTVQSIQQDGGSVRPVPSSTLQTLFFEIEITKYPT